MYKSFWPQNPKGSDAQRILSVIGQRLMLSAVAAPCLYLSPWLIKQLGPALWALTQHIAALEVMLSNNGVPVSALVAFTFLTVIVRLRTISILTALAQKEVVSECDAQAAIAVFKANENWSRIYHGFLLWLGVASVFGLVSKIFTQIAPDPLTTLVYVLSWPTLLLAANGPWLMTLLFPSRAMGSSLRAQFDLPLTRIYQAMPGINVMERIWSKTNFGFLGYPPVLTYVVRDRANYLPQLTQALQK